MLRVPLQAVRIPATGETAVKPFLRLLVHTGQGDFTPLRFLVDSGSSLTTIAVSRANTLGLIVPEKVVTLNVQTAVGRIQQRRRPGRITARVPGLPGRQFFWPCHFVEDAGGSPPISALSLTGVIDDLRITFDGSYSLEARYGWMLLEPR
jgi:hypothetical protein